MQRHPRGATQLYFVLDMGYRLFKTDYADDVHMNWNGQRKLSEYLGEYLVSNYDFENKTGLDEYAQWDSDYDIMMGYINDFWNLYNEK